VSPEQGLEHGKELALLEAHVIDQCLPGLRFVPAAQRRREKMPELCVLRAQAFGERAVAIGLEQRQQIALFLGEMGFDAGKFGAELGLGAAGKQMPAEAQRAVMLTGQLGEAGVALHGGSL